jgi:hypothetical protein
MSVRACHRGAKTRTGAVGGWHHLGTAAQCGEVHAAHCVGQGRQGKGQKEHTRTSVRMFRTRVPTSAGARGSRQKKKRPGRAVAATGVPSVLKRRTQTLNFIPTDHIQRHRSPGPKRFGHPVFALGAQSTFCIRSISQPGYTTQQPTAVGVHGGSV